MVRFGIESYDAEGRLDGELRTWSKDQKPTLRETYDHGHRVGIFERWTEAGILAERGEYVQDQQNGLWQSWSSDGELVSEGHYDHGLKVGDLRYWTIRPYALFATEHYDESGQPDGEFCFWVGPSRRKQCARIDHGTGTLRDLDEDGKTLSVVHWKHGN